MEEKRAVVAAIAQEQVDNDDDDLDHDGDDLDHAGDGNVCRIIRGDGCRSKAALINARARDLRGIIQEGHPPLPSLII